ncbi:efflux transporter outer membrane subunit [Undibacterium oligocarboniphilum]|uniref:Efflux transporter outer membrane subunit n=1 Tax=Undibacterium oligocarboniphilum TaxID=666702 RepID=A0A850QFR8_9BURK|nr:efflux transporter outer membrane subunit [Undibacterium oligocarboniphilum]MBC3870410.1 efflux transporter outer membrane subunit [Undibacterium oligocarboniphilum]NVO78401.1 efflux transporter outer membrane subunit [Undibacterium oligocarboniphilum]
MKPKLPACAAICLILSACSTPLAYQPPVIPMPERWQAMPQHTSALPENSPWWQAFADPELSLLMDEAERLNMDIERARILLRKSRAEYQGISAIRNPVVQGNALSKREHESANVDSSAFSQPGETGSLFQAGFDASWEADFFGARRQFSEAASAELGATQAGLSAMRITILAEVARNYIELRKTEALTALAQEDTETAQDMLKLVRSRSASGFANGTDLISAEAGLISAQMASAPLSATRNAALNRLSVLLGRYPGELQIKILNRLPATPHALPSALPSELLRQRPDILVAERHLAAASARLGAAQADWYPRFSLIGQIGLASSAFGTLAEGASRIWRIAPSLSWPILRSGKITATIQVRDAEQQQALIAYRQTILQAVEDVENSLTIYTQEQNLQVQHLTNVALAKNRLGLAESHYAAGLSDYRAVLTAKHGWTAARQEQIRSAAALAVNWIAINKAFAGDFYHAEAKAHDSYAGACLQKHSSDNSSCTTLH